MIFELGGKSTVITEPPPIKQFAPMRMAWMTAAPVPMWTPSQTITPPDKVTPGAAGQFRANLAIIRSEQGDFVEARSLLDGARQQVPNAARLTKGTIHCTSAQVELLAGDTAAAIVSLSHAEAIAEEMQAKPDSELGMAIAEARALIGD